MRVTCFFVSVAIMLAEQSSAHPIAGLPSLAVLGNDGQLVNGVANTLHPLPLAGGMTSNLLQVESAGDLLSTTQLVGQKGLTNNLGEITASLQRRQGLELLSTVGSIANGVEYLPVLGSVGSVAPVTQGLTSKVGSLNGALPDVKKVAAKTGNALSVPSLKANDLTASLHRRQGIELLSTVGSIANSVESLPLLGSVGSVAPVTHGVTSKVGSLNSALPDVKKVVAQTGNNLPTSSLKDKLPSLLKRATGVPLVGNFPLVSSIPGVKELGAVPGLNALPSMDAVPGFSRFSALNSIPGVSSLESISDVVPMSGLTKRAGGIPGLGSIPVISSMPGITNVPGISSVPGLNALPSIDSLPGLNALPFTGGVPGITGVKSIASDLPIPSLFKRDTGLGSLPLIGSLPSMPSLPGMGSLPSIPGMGSLPSMASLPSMGSIPSMPSLPGMSSLPSLPKISSLPLASSLPSLPSMPSVPGLGSLTSGGLPGMSGLGGLL